ncbi:MAG: hypothetical protein JO097_04710 [Acidobacteriaceae bacterium]|nr:hypothetical protein [Acidobacteriaceae bacterium]
MFTQHFQKAHPLWNTLEEESNLLVGLLPAEQTTFNSLKRTGNDAVNRSENVSNVILNNRPVIRGQRQYRETPPGKILLMDESLVAGNENLETNFFCHSQQVAVFQITPSHIGRRNNLALAEFA